MVEIKKEIKLENGEKVIYTFRSLKAKEIIMAKRAARMPTQQGGYTVDDDKLAFVLLSKMILSPRTTYEEILELDTFVIEQFNAVLQELKSSFLGEPKSDSGDEGTLSE